MMTRVFAFLSLAAVLTLARFVPHPPNFSPMLALALFAGAKAPQRWLGYLVPLAALWLSDLLIGTHDMMIITGLALLLATGMGAWTENNLSKSPMLKKALGWAGAGLAASIVFFLISNFFVWETSGIYPLTREGLWNCYVMALPFFDNQILSTWMFSSVAFGAWAALAPSEVAARKSTSR